MVLDPIAAEIDEDRDSLLDIVNTLGTPVRRYKVAVAWLAEKLGRLTFNGRLTGHSPLSRVIELELLRLGVEGKAAGWRALRQRAVRDPRLDAEQLLGLLGRARQQANGWNSCASGPPTRR